MTAPRPHAPMRRPASQTRHLSSLVLLSTVAAAACPSLAQAPADAPNPAAAPAADPAPAPRGRAATGQDPGPREAPKEGVKQQAGSKEAAAKDAGDVRDRVLPEVAFTDVQVEDMMQFLQDVSGDRFRAVVVHRGGTKVGPAVTMRLRNVTVGQVLDVLTTAYPSEVDIRSVDGPTGPVSVVTITPPDGSRGAGGAGGAGGGAAGEPGQGVRVYRLSGIVASVVREKGYVNLYANVNQAADAKAAEAAVAELGKRTTAALNDVLSLIKATLQQAGGEKPTLQVHEETQTLIFRGTAAQRAALEDVLSALESTNAIRPATPSELADRKQKELNLTLEKARAEADAARVEAAKKVDRLEEELQKMNAVLRSREVMAEQLKMKLDELQKQQGPRGDAGGAPSPAVAAIQTVSDQALVVRTLTAQLGMKHPTVVARLEELRATLDRAIPLAVAEYGDGSPVTRALRQQAAAIADELRRDRPTAGGAQATAVPAPQDELAANIAVLEHRLKDLEAAGRPADEPQLKAVRTELEQLRAAQKAAPRAEGSPPAK